LTQEFSAERYSRWCADSAIARFHLVIAATRGRPWQFRAQANKATLHADFLAAAQLAMQFALDTASGI